MIPITSVILVLAVLTATQGCNYVDSSCSGQVTTDCNTANCCSSNCCTSASNCCASSSSCCAATSTCCQGATSTCQAASCQVSSCCSTCQNQCQTQQCVSRCSQNCCPSIPPPVKICENKTEIIKENEVVPYNGGGGNSTNVNSNHLNFTTALNINNTINTVNSIHIPINVSNVNINNIEVRSWSSTALKSSGGENQDCETTTCKPGNNTVTVTVKVPVPVPVPVPRYIYVTRPVIVPQPVPVPHPVPVPVPVPYPVRVPQPTNGCCVNFNPCISISSTCSPYNMQCGDSCLSNYQYTPTNPCAAGGCYRRSFGVSTACYGSQCQGFPVDCSRCNTDFYQTYEGYRMCRGCFYS